MPTSPVTPRVLFISDSYLFAGRILDATRYSFTKALSEVSEAVCFFHANSYQAESYPEKLETTLREFKPNLIIAINSGCLRQSLLDYAGKQQIAIITWFWDSPVLFGYEQNRLARQTIVFHSDSSYKSHGGIDGSGDWMPFSSIPAVPYKRNPTKDICFQGTLWSMTRVLQDAAFGLVCETDGKYYFGSALHKALTERLDTASLWKSSLTETTYPYGVLLNALSALKRAKTLSWFAHKDLHIYGDLEWLTYLWPVAPELLHKCRYLEAQSHKEMRSLFADHRCSLNVFHLQNKLGGPNLRILDSATHFAPILSDYNQRCHELYPHGEAAFYFKNSDEALEGSDRILHEPGFGDKLAQEAAKILNAGHTHQHRIQTMLTAAQITYERQGCPCSVKTVSNTLPEDLFLADEQIMPSQKLEPSIAMAFHNPNSFGVQERDQLQEKSHVAYIESWLVNQSPLQKVNNQITEYKNLVAQNQAIESELRQLREELQIPIHKLIANRLKKRLLATVNRQ